MTMSTSRVPAAMSTMFWPPIRQLPAWSGSIPQPPKIYEALKAADKLGKITVIAFDEDPVTLGAVKEGSFAGTVVQQPFEWGYQGNEAHGLSTLKVKSPAFRPTSLSLFRRR